MNEQNKNKIKQIIDEHKKNVAALEQDQTETISKAAELIINSLKNGGRIYICGNGGSAADAQHIAAELLGKFQKDRKALPAVALTTDTSVITSISNDYGYGCVFAREVEALVNKGDILWAISTSGDSENVLQAAKLARKKGAAVLGFTGKVGSKLEQISNICLCARNKSTARSQEIHQLSYHIICELVEQSISEK
jgi:D-sedoheptulose 7-phosphate isomerase